MGILGFVIALGTYLAFKDLLIFDGLIWIILMELIVVVGFGVVKINDMSLFRYIFKLMKGNDRRPYSNRKGVFDKDDFTIF